MMTTLCQLTFIKKDFFYGLGTGGPGAILYIMKFCQEKRLSCN